MRTNIGIDDDLMRAALRATGERTNIREPPVPRLRI